MPRRTTNSLSIGRPAPKTPRRSGRAQAVEQPNVQQDLNAVRGVADAGPVEDPETQRKLDVLDRAKKRFRRAMEADSFDREEALLDLRFYLGQQWDDGTYNERFNAGRPALTINRIRPIVLMVSNEFRQQRPSIQVLPVGSGADIQTAEIEEGIVRHIENLSDAEIAYDFANEMMVACGRGSFRFIT